MLDLAGPSNEQSGVAGQLSHPIWILADPHGGHDPNADRALLALLDRAADAPVDLLILGDLFVAWLGPDRFWTPLQTEVMARLFRLRAAGRRIWFVVGNRDYLIRESLLGRGFDRVLEEETVIELGGVPTLVLHGDLVHAGDRAYRAWHHLSRSGLAKGALNLMPGAVGRKLAASVERRLAGTNPRYKTGLLPLDALAQVGRRAAAAGAARALLGHFHHDRTLDVPGGVPVIVAPGFFEHRRVLVVAPDGRLVSTPDDALG